MKKEILLKILIKTVAEERNVSLLFLEEAQRISSGERLLRLFNFGTNQ